MQSLLELSSSLCYMEMVQSESLTLSNFTSTRL